MCQHSEKQQVLELPKTVAPLLLILYRCNLQGKSSTRQAVVRKDDGRATFGHCRVLETGANIGAILLKERDK